ncbi:MAG: leucine-rich repeat domain-containing protein [Clostridia bacterium]|nr:leucine-rich repeat domain-containing protein [Clostridia bacterium]
MFRSIPLGMRVRRMTAALLSAVLLFPALTAPLYAQPGDSDPTVDSGAIDDGALPIWNGGAAERYGGSGTQSDPYRISGGEELALLAQNVRAGESFAGKYFLLTEDILLNDTADYSHWSETAPARRWIPIGGYATVHVGSEEDFARLTAESDGLLVRTEEGYQPAEGYQSGVIYYRLTVFSGVFDGGGHTVSGLYTADGSDYLGLFGACKDAVLRNITLSELYIQGDTRVGGLVGALYADGNLTVSNCSVKGTVGGNESVGGLIGYAEAAQGGKLTVTSGGFSGSLSASVAAGGVLGGSGYQSGVIQLSDCVNDGQITAKSAAGGIVGRLYGSGDQISSCKNNGAIRADEDLGGIAGLVHPADGIVTVSSCQNGGTLLSVNTAGGIVGRAVLDGEYSALELLSCKNVGELIGGQSVGGIIGTCSLSGTENYVNLSGNKNSAAIRGSAQVGGIIGSVAADAGTLSVGVCQNYGATTATDGYVGGIIGYGEAAAVLSLYECSVRATVTAGVSHSGGIAGALHATKGTVLIERCSVGGTVSADQSADGVSGSVVGTLIASDATAVAEIRNCLGAATVSAKSSAGGIVGQLTAENGQCRITSSLFCGGIVTGCKLSGGIAATAHAVNPNSAVQIVDCYYSQNTSSRAMFPYGGEGNESCLTTEALSDEALRNPEKLGGLDFSIWQAPASSQEYPTLQSVPFVWEEFQYTVTRDGAILDAYLGRSEVVVIPEKLGGVVVSAISSQAFWQSEVVRITMPNSVNAVGEAAFAGSTKLERVTLSANLNSIGNRAFQGCTMLSELRCTGSLSTLLIGSENEPFRSVSAGGYTHPVTLQIVHSYEDGASAGKGTELSVYPGDYYEIEPLRIEGYKADPSSLSGICDTDTRVTVIYRLGTYHLSIRYLYPDGSEVFPSFEGDFQFGESYQVSTPALDGYTADYLLMEGAMPGKDTVLTVYYSQDFASHEEQEGATLKIALLILSGLLSVCCLVYFIYRYRSGTEPVRQDRRY